MKKNERQGSTGEGDMIEQWRSLVGERSGAVVNGVEKGAVRKFAEAIGDSNPLYVDEEAAKGSRYGGVIAPPTFPRTLEYGWIEDMGWPESGMIHGEHRTSYQRPLRVGEQVYCYTRLKDYHEKEGREGTLGFVIIERVGESPDGKRIFIIEDTGVVTPTLRRSLEG